jgi:predicted PurR-regulated permease PerM
MSDERPEPSRSAPEPARSAPEPTRRPSEATAGGPPPGAPAAPPLQSRLAPQLQAVLLAGSLIAAVLLFQALATLILLVLVTVLIAIPLAAFAGRLKRWRVPRPVGALLGLVVGIGAVVAVMRLVLPPLVKELRRLASAAPETIERLRERYLDLVGAPPTDTGEQVQRLVDRFLDQPLTIIEPLLSVGLGVVGVLFTVVLVLLTAYYIAVRPEPLLNGIVQIFPPQRREWAQHVMARLRVAWIGWLKGVVADMLVSGTLLYIGLSLVGLDFALLFSVLTALLVVVPYFGAIVGGIPPILLALTDSPEKALLVLIVYVAVQQIEGNVIIPLIMSQTVRLHPALIAVGVVAVGALFGFVGLFVAVPVLSTVQILVDELWVRPAERAHRGPGPVEEQPLPDVPPEAAEPAAGPGEVADRTGPAAARAGES